MKPYAIKAIPNSPNGELSRKQLKDTKNYTYKTHGRGHRFGGGEGASRYAANYCGGYYQCLPLPLAARFTLYGYVKNPRGPSETWPKDYWRYIGRKNNKPIIRQMTHDYPATLIGK